MHAGVSICCCGSGLTPPNACHAGHRMRRDQGRDDGLEAQRKAAKDPNRFQVSALRAAVGGAERAADPHLGADTPPPVPACDVLPSCHNFWQLWYGARNQSPDNQGRPPRPPTAANSARSRRRRCPATWAPTCSTRCAWTPRRGAWRRACARRWRGSASRGGFRRNGGPGAGGGCRAAVGAASGGRVLITARGSAGSPCVHMGGGTAAWGVRQAALLAHSRCRAVMLLGRARRMACTPPKPACCTPRRQQAADAAYKARLLGTPTSGGSTPGRGTGARSQGGGADGGRDPSARPSSAQQLQQPRRKGDPPRVNGRVVSQPVPDFGALHGAWERRLAAAKEASRRNAAVPEVSAGCWSPWGRRSAVSLQQGKGSL